MTVILDNGQKFQITKIMGVLAGVPSLSAPMDGDIAIYFIPCSHSSVKERGWWWLSYDSRNRNFFADPSISIVEKEKKFLKNEMIQSHSENRWYEYSGKNDRHNADLAKEI